MSSLALTTHATSFPKVEPRSDEINASWARAAERPGEVRETGRPHQLRIALRGTSRAWLSTTLAEVEQCSFEVGFLWLCGIQAEPILLWMEQLLLPFAESGFGGAELPGCPRRRIRR